MHAGDGGVGCEPARAGSPVHPLTGPVAVGTGDLAEQLGAEALAEGHAIESSQGSTTVRLLPAAPDAAGGVTGATFDFEYSKFLPSKA